jgi:hypothetical protein
MINPDFLIEKEVFLRKDLCSNDFLISGATPYMLNEWPFIPDKVVRKVIDVDTSDNTFRTDDGYWISLTKIEGFVKNSISVTLEEDFLLTLI